MRNFFFGAMCTFAGTFAANLLMGDAYSTNEELIRMAAIWGIVWLGLTGLDYIWQCYEGA